MVIAFAEVNVSGRDARPTSGGSGAAEGHSSTAAAGGKGGREGERKGMASTFARLGLDGALLEFVRGGGRSFVPSPARGKWKLPPDQRESAGACGFVLEQDKPTGTTPQAVK